MTRCLRAVTELTILLITIVTLDVSVVHAQAGNPIVQPPAPITTSTNVTVNVTPPPPDPQATQGMMDFLVSNTEYNHVSVPVTMASGLLAGPNIWTSTPWSMINLDTASKLRAVARNVAMSLFLLGITWTGAQLAFGSATGTTSYQQLLPLLIAGFLLAMYSDTLAVRSVDICNWLNQQFGNPSLTDFTGSSLTLPAKPDLTNQPPGIIGVPAAFFSGLITSVLYAIVLLILEVKMLVRDAVLIVTTTVMPISGALWAFQITRGWGVTLFRLFFGWLFGQPLVVICLSLAGSLLTFFNNVDGPSQILVKLAVLFLAIKLLTLFAGGGLAAGGMFSIASMLFLLRRAQGLANRGSSTSSGATPATTTQNAPVVGLGIAGGTGTGTGATGRPYRPAFGAA